MLTILSFSIVTDNFKLGLYPVPVPIYVPSLYICPVEVLLDVLVLVSVSPVFVLLELDELLFRVVSVVVVLSVLVVSTSLLDILLFDVMELLPIYNPEKADNATKVTAYSFTFLSSITTLALFLGHIPTHLKQLIHSPLLTKSVLFKSIPIGQFKEQALQSPHTLLSFPIFIILNLDNILNMAPNGHKYLQKNLSINNEPIVTKSNIIKPIIYVPILVIVNNDINISHGIISDGNVIIEVHTSDIININTKYLAYFRHISKVLLTLYLILNTLLPII